MMNHFKTLFIIILSMLLSISLFGCSLSSVKNKNDNATGNLSTQPPQVVQAEFGHGIVNPNPDDRLLVYNGKKIEIEYMLDNVGAECNLGILMFINGIIQPYSIVGENDNRIMNIFDMNSKEKRIIKLEFTPVCGQKGTDTVINFAVMLNPKNIADKSSLFKSGNNHRLNLLLPWKIKFNKDCKFDIDSYNTYNINKIDNDFLKKYANTTNAIDPIKTVLSICGKEDAFYEMASTDVISIELKLFGSREQRVRTIIYLDHFPIRIFNGNTYMDWSIKKDSICSLSTELPEKLKKGKHILYAITIPVTDGYIDNIDDMNKTQTITFNIN